MTGLAWCRSCRHVALQGFICACWSCGSSYAMERLPLDLSEAAESAWLLGGYEAARDLVRASRGSVL